MSSPADADTIAAVATAQGAAGVGIVRLSGSLALAIGRALCGGRALHPRRAVHARFLDREGNTIDDGIAIYFAAPASYTGEHVVELQAHGSPVLLAQLLRRLVELGARQARPGEFTERAFLAGKLDLAQAEAVADLINAGSEAAAKAARRSLDGEFSRRVHALIEGLTQARVYLEAALDFPDEDIDFLAAPAWRSQLASLSIEVATLLREASVGKRLMDGLHAVIIGAPNVGKSSLLNALAADDRAIVSDIAGTTRDLLRETIQLDGLTLTLVDTAGLRDAPDAIEAEGIRRARAELDRADVVLALIDAREAGAQARLAAQLPGSASQVLWLHAKSDLLQGPSVDLPDNHLLLSSRDGTGLDALRCQLLAMAGVQAGGSFSARGRHVDALQACAGRLLAASERLAEGSAELAAEDLRSAQLDLGQITGPVDADALLGRIFSGFCIGK